MDALADFFEEYCVIGPDECVTSANLYGVYQQSHQKNGGRPMSKKKFGAKLRERGYADAREAGARCWFGIGLRSQHLGETDALESEPEVPLQEDDMEENPARETVNADFLRHGDDERPRKSPVLKHPAPRPQASMLRSEQRQSYVRKQRFPARKLSVDGQRRNAGKELASGVASKGGQNDRLQTGFGTSGKR
jgi:phage/plasmid-associated DNA primase